MTVNCEIHRTFWSGRKQNTLFLKEKHMHGEECLEGIPKFNEDSLLESWAVG